MMSNTIKNSERSGKSPDQTGTYPKPDFDDPTRSGTSDDADADAEAKPKKRMVIREIDGRLELVEEESDEGNQPHK